MKPIKCPNCGKRMVAGYFPGLVAAYECDGCGVRGPIDEGGSVRRAARLMREWIARMEADTNALVNHKAREVEYLTEKRCAEELRKCINDATNGGVLPLDELLEKWEVTP